MGSGVRWGTIRARYNLCSSATKSILINDEHTSYTCPVPAPILLYSTVKEIKIQQHFFYRRFMWMWLVLVNIFKLRCLWLIYWFCCISHKVESQVLLKGFDNKSLKGQCHVIVVGMSYRLGEHFFPFKNWPF
jgi:hypothetical protein